MKLYSKFLLTILPLFFVVLFLVTASFYQLVREPLLVASEQGLLLKADEAQKFIDDYFLASQTPASPVLADLLEEQAKVRQSLTRSDFGDGKGVFVLQGERLYIPNMTLQSVAISAVRWEADALRQHRGEVRFQIEMCLMWGITTMCPHGIGM
jgi:hypothetical protein